MPDDITAVLDQPNTTPAPVASADWRTYLTDDLKADPVVSSWSEKASEKDIPTLIKGYAHAQKRMGSAINLPGKDAKPEDVAALRTKLYEAGVFQAPPEDPKGYDIKMPETLPEGVRWSEELTGKFAGIFHKHGISKSAVDELLPLYMAAVGGASQALQIDQAQSLATLKAEHGEQYDARMEAVKRMSAGIFTDPSEVAFFEQTGLGDHPKFLSVMLRLAPLAMQDSSFIDSLPRKGGEISGEDAKAELSKIMNDATHPMHKGFQVGDKNVEAHIAELYRQAYGTEKKVIGEGVRI